MVAKKPGDGRRKRGERTRFAVADALISLYEEGSLRPTAAMVAQRAGVSTRLVHHHFRDRETLLDAAANRQMARTAKYVEPVPLDQPLSSRLETFVRVRTRLLEAIGPIRRAAMAEAPFSQVIKQRLAAFRAAKREQVALAFGLELDGARSGDQLVALCAVASWSMWEELRANQGLSVARARRVMQASLATLLGSWQ